jgi:chromate reductase
MERRRHLLMISGSLRQRSTNTGLLLTVRAIAPPTVVATFYGGMADLPQFNPDDDGPAPPPRAADLREQIRRADAVLFSTPEYAGALPGSFKNLLDWAVGDDQPGSMNQKPVAYVNVSPRGAGLAHASLRNVLGYLGADVVEAACLDIPLTQEALGDDGLVPDPHVREELVSALGALLPGAVRR